MHYLSTKSFTVINLQTDQSNHLFFAALQRPQKRKWRLQKIWMNLATLVYPLKRFSRQLYNRHIFSSDKLLIPINDNGNHWTLTCINFSTKNIQYLDSLGNPGQIYTNSCLQYIKDEHWSKLNAPLHDQNKWTAQQNRDEVPHQIKGYDLSLIHIWRCRRRG